METSNHLTQATLYRVAAALMALLALTVGLAYVHLGPFNMAAALGVATVKALLVILFFMEVRYSSHLVWIVSALSLLWLFILLGGTLADYFTRAAVVLPPG